MQKIRLKSIARKVRRRGKEYLKCPFCGYEWTPRKELPKVCPYCKKYIIMFEASGDDTGGQERT